jgi:hypothetical protein
MSLLISPYMTQRQYQWTTFKSILLAKKGSLQYEDDGQKYILWFYDGHEVIICNIWLGIVSDVIIQNGYTQEQNDIDKIDFENTYKILCNGPIVIKANDGFPLFSIAQRQSDGLPQIAIAPTIGSETIIASHNLCDKCSWFGDSVRVTDEILVDSGDGYTFNSQHTYWIDAISGRFYDDEGASNAQKVANPSDPHGYLVVVKVGGVEQTMREPFETSGGDYEVIWETGQIKFFSAPVEAPVVSYSYAEGSTFYVRPAPGKVLRILRAEADVSIGCVMTDTINYSIFALVDAVAPELVSGNIVPSGTMISIGEAVYKRMGQISAEAQGAYPAIEVLGSSNEELTMSIEEFRRKSRGTRTKVQALPFNYSTTRDLSSAAQMEIRVHLKHDRPFIGDTVTITFYCVSKDEV